MKAQAIKQRGERRRALGRPASSTLTIVTILLTSSMPPLSQYAAAPHVVGHRAHAAHHVAAHDADVVPGADQHHAERVERLGLCTHAVESCVFMECKGHADHLVGGQLWPGCVAGTTRRGAAWSAPTHRRLVAHAVHARAAVGRSGVHDYRTDEAFLAARLPARWQPAAWADTAPECPRWHVLAECRIPIDSAENIPVDQQARTHHTTGPSRASCMPAASGKPCRNFHTNLLEPSARNDRKKPPPKPARTLG